MTWNIKKISNPAIKNPILIEGLPGVGNVGKIAIDFLIDNLKAKKLCELHSYSLPHCVFVNEENLVELPSIEVFYKNYKDRTLLLLSGDIQPIDEPSCYEFCDNILDLVQNYKGKKEIITLGGIAIEKDPKKPKVYCTANQQTIRKKYAGRILKNNTYGKIGPIVGVSGLLVGLAGKRSIPALALLAETYGHPNHLGINSAKEILGVLNDKLKLKLKLSGLDAELIETEEEPKQKKLIKSLKKQGREKNFDYIG